MGNRHRLSHAAHGSSFEYVLGLESSEPMETLALAILTNFAFRAHPS